MRLEVIGSTVLYYLAFRYIRKRKIFRTLFFGIAGFLVSSHLAIGAAAMTRVIHAMHLHENGLKVDIVFIDRSSLAVNITDI